jgi:hypothetical protein
VNRPMATGYQCASVAVSGSLGVGAWTTCGLEGVWRIGDHLSHHPGADAATAISAVDPADAATQHTQEREAASDLPMTPSGNRLRRLNAGRAAPVAAQRIPVRGLAHHQPQAGGQGGRSAALAGGHCPGAVDQPTQAM